MIPAITAIFIVLVNWYIAAGIIGLFIHFIGLPPVLQTIGTPEAVASLLSAIIIAVITALALTPLGEKYNRYSMVREPNHEQKQRLTELFQRVCLAARISPQDYELYIQNGNIYNAFALGRRTIAISEPLLQAATDEEAMAILSHELGHHVHHDTTYNTINMAAYHIALFALKALQFVCRITGFLARIPAPVINLVFIFINWFSALYFIIATKCIQFPAYIAYQFGSRQSEYAADQFAATIGLKQPMINALQLIERMNQGSQAPTGIKDMLLATHPDTESRIQKLQSLKETTIHHVQSGEVLP